ncbi:MAG: WXG100 family type VII secretion target [Bacillota bacterium]|nr:WXG100 family type VII secretion target [Bacillota bacterium]MDW7685007.1 WXG100 family type VII secretion target [Bacillota bacterium]
MSQVHVDPDKLRSFAGELKKFTDVVDNYFNVLNNELNRLGASWEDQEYDRFKREFIPVRQVLKTFVGEAGKLVPKLETDASVIEEFLKRGR